jgi:hypothetical protein
MAVAAAVEVEDWAEELGLDDVELPLGIRAEVDGGQLEEADFLQHFNPVALDPSRHVIDVTPPHGPGDQLDTLLVPRPRVDPEDLSSERATGGNPAGRIELVAMCAVNLQTAGLGIG